MKPRFLPVQVSLKIRVVSLEQEEVNAALTLNTRRFKHCQEAAGVVHKR